MLQVCQDSVSRVLQVRTVFRPLVVFVLRVLAVPKSSQYARYVWSMKYTSTVWAPCRQLFVSLLGTKHSQMWSHEWELERITFAGDNSGTQITGQSFENMYYCECSQCFEFLYCGYCLHSKYHVFQNCAYICLCSPGSILLILSVLSLFRSSHHSQYVGLLSVCRVSAASAPILSALSLFRPTQHSQYVGLLSACRVSAASAPILSVLGLRVVLEHPSMKPLFYLEHQETRILLEYIYIYI